MRQGLQYRRRGRDRRPRALGLRLLITERVIAEGRRHVLERVGVALERLVLGAAPDTGRGERDEIAVIDHFRGHIVLAVHRNPSVWANRVPLGGAIDETKRGAERWSS